MFRAKVKKLLFRSSFISSVLLSTMGTSSSALAAPGVNLLETYAFPAEFPYAAKDFLREDESEDSRFYSQPRFVTHIDEKAIDALKAFYKAAFEPGSTVLDLCSSWISHYPDTKLKEVVGVGMNEAELKANGQLTRYYVTDLNQNPSLSMLQENEFDTITNAVSVDYLNKPLKVFAEMYRVLKPGGTAIMSFSNRCFPTKVINIWLRTDDTEHVQIVANYFHFSGFSDIKAYDISPGRNSDPMYVVLGKKPSSPVEDCTEEKKTTNKL